MHQQRKAPSKRYSSYIPATDQLSNLEDHVSRIPNGSDTEKAPPTAPTMRSGSVGGPEKVLRRKSLNTLHFDALQNAVSKLARIDDFDLEELGYGFFSDVFKVTHKQSGKVMVLKRNKSTNSKLNILREVQLMNRLSHPNILKFIGVCVHEGQLHGLTEFINGGDLDQLVQDNVPLSWMVRIRLALDISRGLTYLHSLGIFHRDLTARNCLIRITTESSGKKKYAAIVADLGLAEKIPKGPLEEAKLKVVGTPYCMAPEVLKEMPYNQQSDIFSFGIIICQLIVRTSSDPERLPRSHDFGLARDLFCAMITKGVGAPDPTPPSTQPPIPPNSFVQLAIDCCEVDQTKRPSVEQLPRRLEQIIAEEKMTRAEKKRIAKPKTETSTKRHSSVLTEIPSLSGLETVGVIPKDSPKQRQLSGSDKENGHPAESGQDSPLSEKTTYCDSIRRASESNAYPRLSRSYSDISSELISCAASIIASSRETLSSISDEDDKLIMDSLNEAFMNPFSAIEEIEVQRKILDEPSSEVLEMSFDLPAVGLPPGSPSRTRRLHVRHQRRRRSARPSSLRLDPLSQEMESDPLARLNIPGIQSPHALTPEPYAGVHRLPHLPAFLDTQTSPCSHSSVSSTIQDGPNQRSRPSFSSGLKQALIRSMALSRQGCRLLSWWQCHSRNMDWKSVSSVLSLLTEKMGRVRRSVSLPDLCHDPSSLVTMRERLFTDGACSNCSSTSSGSSTPRTPVTTPISQSSKGGQMHPHFATLPRKKSRFRSVKFDPGSKRRSRTSDDVFQDPALLEILHEEGADQRMAEGVSHCPPHSPNPLPHDKDLSEAIVHKLGAVEINNNFSPRLKEQKDGQQNTVGSTVHATTTCTTGTPGIQGGINTFQGDSAQLPGRDGFVSSSSSSSGTSSTGLKMTIHTGIISSSRRRRVGVAALETGVPNDSGCSSPPGNVLPTSPSVSSSSVDSAIQSWKGVRDPGSREPEEQKLKNNRDSGYNEDVIFSDHSDGSFLEPHKIHRPQTAPNTKSVVFTNPTQLKAHISAVDRTLSELGLMTKAADYPPIAPRCVVGRPSSALPLH